METHSSQRYRPDIDGLRAIAVLSVIIFHIKESLIPGGFAGVDIFFVISGFLISQNILLDIEAGRFSITDFYRRRVKRIAPAMLAVIAFTLLATQILFRPEDAENAAQSAFWSLLSLPNVYFWLYQDTGYFAQASHELPLLHMWSLGVEEQFYLFWPLLLLTVYKPCRKAALIATFVCLAVGSFLLGEKLFSNSPSFAYYMLPTRAGELLLGAIVAVLLLNKADCRIPQHWMTAASIMGTVLICSSLFLLSENQVFPGWRAVPPTLGTAMVIFAGRTSVSRILSIKPMVFIGLISYSAYLWHWPILAIYRYGYASITPLAAIALIAFIGVIAYLSYRYIEQPGRRLNGKAITIFMRQYVVPAGVLGVTSLAAMKLDGYGLRWIFNEYDTKLSQVREQTRPAMLYDYVCQRQRIEKQDIENPKCITGSSTNEMPSAILWGDSHSAHYIGMVSVFAREGGYRVRNLQIGACPPIFEDPEPFTSAKRLADCRDSAAVQREALSRYNVVFLSAAWLRYHDSSKNFLPALFRTIEELTAQGKRVVIFGSVPVIDGYDRLCREKQLSFPFVECPLSHAPEKVEVLQINSTLKAFADQTENVEYFDANSNLCRNGMCSAFNSKGEPMYYDATHITMAASWTIGEQMLTAEGLPGPFHIIDKRRAGLDGKAVAMR